tara:strand:- start:954 stop:1718 length:765 start_codon:yes stop_codon:yes gene_type:complete
MTSIYKSLEDKVVIITGGSQGIGKSMVFEFVKQKSKVYFLDIDKEGALKLIDELEKQNLKKPFFYECNITNFKELTSVIEKIGEENGVIDVLINNAANDQRHKIQDVDEKLWKDRIDINLSHSFFAIKSSIPYLKKSKSASVINFSSINWVIGSKDTIVYQAAKSAVFGLTKGFARELGEYRIRVNAIVPGWIITERQLELWLTPELDKWRSEQQSLPDKVYPDDVAKLALFLGSNDSKMITAQFHKIDGGWMN